MERKKLLMFLGISAVAAIIIWLLLHMQKAQTLKRQNAGNEVDVSIFKPYGDVTPPSDDEESS